ncbi:MAG: NADPH-dependent FMN reductase, partial [Alphaproteobacteria bacterium]
MSDRPKVAVIIGSLRAQSVNRRLAEAIAKTVAGKLDLQIVDYADVPLYNQDHEADP